MAPYVFPQNQRIQNFNFSEKNHCVHFLRQKRHSPGRLHAINAINAINAITYCDTLTRLQRAIQNKRRGMLSRGVYLVHDNAQLHSVHVTTVLLEKFKCDLMDHPPYSPDLAPSDFHLFLHLKKHLTGKKFDDDDEVHDSGSKGRLQTSVTPEYRSWFQDLINVWTMPAAVLKDQVMYIISFTVLLL